LFNLRHSSARNVVERIFGVLKRRFRILLLAPGYSLDIQARIPASLCAIHNFIRNCDPDEGPLLGDEELNDIGYSAHPGTTGGAAGEDEMNGRRDQIAQDMWEEYRCVCRERGVDEEDPELGDDDYDNELDVLIGDEIV